MGHEAEENCRAGAIPFVVETDMHYPTDVDPLRVVQAGRTAAKRALD